MRAEKYLFTGNSSAWCFEHNCRQGISSATGLERLETSPGSLPSDLGHLAGGGGPICGPVECPAGPVRVVASSADGPGYERPLAQLEQAQGVRVSSVFTDQGLSDEGQTGSGESGHGLPVLAKSALVPGAHGPGLRRSPRNLPGRGPSLVLSRRSESTLPQQELQADRLEIVREGLRKRGLPEDVVKLLLEGNRQTTRSAYQTAWNNWTRWCSGRDRDPLSCDLATVLSFLTESLSQGMAYRTINVLRSMLSSTLGPVEGYPIGRHPLVLRLMKGVYNIRPPAPKYNQTWDVEVVLSSFRRIPNEGLSFAALSYKLVTLLALATMLRVSELASIDASSIRFDNDGVAFNLTKPRKAQRDGSLHSLFVRGIPDVLIDPVACCGFYRYLTDPLRHDGNSGSLFISLVRPHNPVSPSTLARWIKIQLGTAGIDTSTFTAHSTRGAASSAAAKNGCPIGAILRSAHWASESTFTRFYRREVADCPSVSEAVLSSQSRTYNFICYLSTPYS